jgi:hypothetical protein
MYKEKDENKRNQEEKAIGMQRTRRERLRGHDF